MSDPRCLRSGFLASITAAVIATVAASPATAGDCIADLDGDGFVGGSDLGLLLVGWASPGPTDLDGDGTTGGSDLGIMLVDWNCEVSEPPATPPLRLWASETILETGVPTDVRFEVTVPAELSSLFQLIVLKEVDATGEPTGPTLAVFEPISLAPEIGVFDAWVTFDEPVDRDFEVAAIAFLGETTYTSQRVPFWNATFPTEEELDAEAHIYDAAIDIWAANLAEFGNTEAAREATRTALLVDPVVTDVLMLESGLEIRLASGLFHFIATVGADKSGEFEGRLPGQPPHGGGGSLTVETALDDRPKSRIASNSTNCDCAQIKNNKVLIWDPEEWYTRCYEDGALDSDFILGHCYEIKVLSGPACTVESVDSFSDYGTIIVFTHGVLADGGKFSFTTGEQHFPNSPRTRPELVGQVGTAIVGKLLPSNVDQCDFALGNPEFPVTMKMVNADYFTGRQIDLSNSMVILATCSSAKPAALQMQEVFTGQLGACAVLGFTQNTKISWLPYPLYSFLRGLFDGKTINDAFAEIAQRNDGNTPPSFPDIELRNGQAGDLTYDGVVSGLLQPGFEPCAEAWTYSTAESFPAGAYGAFGANQPTEGTAMGVLAAGEYHFSGVTGARQTFCTEVRYDRLAFDWKVVWTPPKWLSPPGDCGTEPGEADIRITLSDGQGGSLVVLDTDARALCGDFVQEGTNPFGDPIFGTSWARLDTDVSGFFAGIDPATDQVTIEFEITNVQASGVLLIDDIEFIP